MNRGDAPLLVELPAHRHRSCRAWKAACLALAGAARRRLVDRSALRFRASLGAPIVHTAISRTVIDVNRDPSGASLYPGQTTTGLCPTETFDGEPLYRLGGEPGPDGDRPARKTLFRALSCGAERRDRAAARHCIATRRALRLPFDPLGLAAPVRGTLPVFNLGTNNGKSADPGAGGARRGYPGEPAARASSSTAASRAAGSRATMASRQNGVHALQMELVEPRLHARAGRQGRAGRTGRHPMIRTTPRRSSAR